MNPEIKIGADARKVDEAREKLKKLRETAEELHDSFGDGLLGNGDLSESSELIRRISEDITRMKSLVKSGEYKGGILNARQWEELGKLSGNINDNLNSWAENINEARTALWKLTQEKERLSKISTTNPEEWVAAQGRIDTIKEEEKGLRKYYDALRAKQGRVDNLQDKAGDLATRAGTLGNDEPPDGGLNISGILKATGIGYLVYKATQFALRGKGMYEGNAPLLSAAYTRGTPTEISMEGYDSLQTAGYGMQLSRSAGYSGGINKDKLQEYLRWSNAAGMTDASFAISQSGALRNLFGKNDTKALNLLSTIAKATQETPERINPILMSGFGMMSGLKMGKEIGVQGGLDFANTFAAMRNIFGDSAAKDPSNYGRLKNALSPTGNKYYDLMFYKKAGIMDGEFGFKQLNRLNQLVQNGALTEEGQKILTELADEMPGGVEGKKHMLATRLGGAWNLTNKEVAMISSGALKGKSYGKGAYGFDTEGYGKRMGNRYQRTVSKNVQKQDFLRYLGQRTAEAMNPLEEKMYGMFNAMSDSDFAKWITQNFGDFVDGMGASYTGTQSGLTEAQLQSNQSTTACHVRNGGVPYALPIPPPPDRLPTVPGMPSHGDGMASYSAGELFAGHVTTLTNSNSDLVSALKELTSAIQSQRH